MDVEDGLTLIGSVADLGYKMYLVHDETPYPSNISPLSVPEFPEMTLRLLQKDQLALLVNNRLETNSGFNLLYLNTKAAKIMLCHVLMLRVRNESADYDPGGDDALN